MNHPKAHRCYFVTVIVGILLIQGNPSFAEERNKDVKARQAYYDGRYQEALKCYVTLALHGDPQGAINAALIFKDIGTYRDAVYFLERVCFKPECDLQVLTLLARVYFLNNQFEEASKMAQKVLKKDPLNIDATLLIGLSAQERGGETSAQEYYRKVLDLDKGNIIARVSLADIYAQRKDYEDAVAEYKKASLIDASVMAVQRMLGELLFRIGKLDESLQIYRKLSYINPQDKTVQSRIKEISDKLGKNYFENERRRLVQKRKERTVLVKPATLATGAPLVRIGVAAGEEQIEFMVATPFEISSVSGGTVLINGLEKQVYSISKTSKGALLVVGPESSNNIMEGAVVIRPLKPEGTVTLLNMIHGKDNFWSNQADRSYRGALVFQPADKGINAINVVSLEEYLYSVVASEMPSKWPLEALKAQAVAARSEAMRKMGRHKAQGFDFCADVHCQSYAGVEQETEKSIKSVDETRGSIMQYDGKPIDAVYSSNCGGHAQGNVFGDQKAVSYWQPRFDSLNHDLVRVPFDPFELELWLHNPPQDILCDTASYGQNGSFRWVRAYTADEMNEMVKKLKDVGAVKRIVVLKRNASGHVATIKILGTKSSLVIERELNIRKALGNLRSSMFKVEIAYDVHNNPRQFIFYGGGWGHGVGMCQSGAFGMAQRGKSYKEILRHYFQGIDFKKAY